MRTFHLLILLAFTQILNAQYLIQSGPMLGYAEAREAVVWLQTVQPSKVFAKYWEEDNPKLSYYTDTVKTLNRNARTAKLYFMHVLPGKRYKYELYVGNNKVKSEYDLGFKTQPDWHYKTYPQNFSIALGSCTYINEPYYDRPGNAYGGDYQIFGSIHSKKPDAMLWLGDNIYLRPADYSSREGYLERYTHTRSLPQMQALLTSCNHFAIWDDHDFGPNDANGSWALKDVALEAFKLFWVNPSFGNKNLPGIYSGFSYMDADFILMDNRYNRTENFEVGEKYIFGKHQSELLINQLKYSRARYKFVVTGGQFLNSAQVYENHANFSQERNYIIKRIEEEEIENVIFLSGDRHHSEVMRYDLNNGNSIYEFTVSPLTSGPSSIKDEENNYRVKGSLRAQRNFAMIKVYGDREDRKLNIVYYDSDGKEIYSLFLD